MALAQNVSASVNPEDAIVELLADYTSETTPAGAAKVEDFRSLLKPGSTVFITFLPGSDFGDTIATAKRLRGEGFNPVPHFAARSIPSRQFLEESLRRLQAEAGVTEGLVIGGAVDKPVGEFASSMQVLETGLFDKYGIRKLGVAGHPEGSPDIRDEEILAALKWKGAFAERTGAELYVVTQFCFEAAPIIAWDKRIQAAGNRLPIRIGIPGLASLKTLLNYARMCGIGASMTFLTKQARNVAKLLTLSAPDRLLADLALYRANDPQCGIVGCHLYPLGGLKKTVAWADAVVDRKFTMNRQGRGFTVELPVA